MKHILIIDDSLSECYLLRHMLERHGYRVSEACNGKEGVQVAAVQQPDLVIMDVVMPELNGFQATRELSKNMRTANIPVVIYSAKDQDVDKMWARRQGAIDYWVKPLSEQELISAVEMHIAAA